MNERIKELLEQAGFEEQDGHISIQGVYMFNTTRMDKFAQLIVEECAGIYCKIDHGNQHLGTDDYLESLQKHFGVSE